MLRRRGSASHFGVMIGYIIIYYGLSGFTWKFGVPRHTTVWWLGLTLCTACFVRWCGLVYWRAERDNLQMFYEDFEICFRASGYFGNHAGANVKSLDFASLKTRRFKLIFLLSFERFWKKFWYFLLRLLRSNFPTGHFVLTPSSFFQDLISDYPVRWRLVVTVNGFRV